MKFVLLNYSSFFKELSTQDIIYIHFIPYWNHGYQENVEGEQKHRITHESKAKVHQPIGMS